MASDPYPFEEQHAIATGTAPAAAPSLPPRARHPLGLPAGSVRALLILMVMGTIWTLLLMPAERNVTVPIYLYYLLFLTTGAYFASRSRPSDGVTGAHEPPPLYLPRGSVRTLIILGFAVVLGAAIYKDRSGFFHRPLLSADELKHATLLLPVVMIGAFLLGIVTNVISGKLLAGPYGLPAWYQDVQAWVSVLAVLGLGAQVILELVVFANMPPEERPHLPQLQLILSAIIAFYFGARI
jgi:hypothetical protein